MVTLVCCCSDSVQQWYYAHLYSAIVKLAEISILSLMELYLENGFIVKLAHAVSLLPEAVFRDEFRCQVGTPYLPLPLGTLLREVLCCLVGRHELSFPACRGYMKARDWLSGSQTSCFSSSRGCRQGRVSLSSWHTLCSTPLRDCS